MRKAQMQISIFHLTAVMLAIILVIYVGLLQSKIRTETVVSNTEAQHLQLIRRLFMSPDCLAYEYRLYDAINGTLFSSRDTKPFVVDVYKFESWEHFNCVRDVIGVDNNPSQFRYYNITLYDLEDGQRWSRASALPKSYDDENDVFLNPDATRECEGLYFFDMFPVIIMKRDYNGQIVFHEGMAYVKDCITGKLVLPNELVI